MVSSTGIRRASLAAAALASVFLLSACAPGTSPVENFPGLPEAEHGESGHETGGDESALQAQWLELGGKLAVTTFGSSTCPVVGTDIKVLKPAGEGNTVEIVVPEPDATTPCTMDYVPHTTVFWTPMNVTTTEKLTVLLGDEKFVLPIK
ncbi:MULTISPECIES: hypothetical protein [Agromyces]|uniref:Lipoprotein n=1 Tax=Agromyces mediolanus TaxID=41986 RepID=A0A918F840_AGRME|nr:MULTISPECIES: hypothetical protein [Agromyces]GGR14418.1 hypothetical protein GCM10010196_03770 [Agromyces mediolanus]GLJ72781.1 hypothetical protein GCM10017583_20370 [Agromyces mediolanus]GLU88998.1 hypothetical protein Agsp01_12530 [Agromyces sp. NBRC 114283]